jgi:Flp pilus assembly protein TadB
MLKAGLIAVAGMLFLLLFASLRVLMQAAWDRASRRRRLRSRKAPQAGGRLRAMPERFGVGRLYRHLADEIGAVGWTVRPESFAAIGSFLAMAGVAAGLLYFRSVASAVLLAAMLGCLPYTWLRMRLLSRQMAVRLDFLPAVELFYQSYLITGCRHVRTALQKAVEERRLPGEAQAVFEQLYRQMSVQEEQEGSLRRFSLAVGSVWADYFASILRVALAEGNQVDGNLKELIEDMRRAQHADRLERHRLLEIRIANFTPAMFLGLFLGINIRLNPEGSYRYYVADKAGREMLLYAVALLFGSLLMGLYLSRRKE